MRTAMKSIKETVEDIRRMPVLAKAVAVGSGIKGINMGKGFPDIDIKLFGIGGHRHWTTHSALTSFALYKTVKWYEKTIEGSMGSGIKRKVLKYVAAPCLAAFSLANAAHLFADMLGAKDVVGWPVGLLLSNSRIKDKVWLGGNAVICLVLTWKFLVIMVEKDKEVVIGEAANDVFREAEVAVCGRCI
jgi:hypothetical protein